MAASFSNSGTVRLLTALARSTVLYNCFESRSLHVTAVCYKNRAARIRIGKGDKPLTYEQAYHPHHIAHRKGWLSQHTSNLKGEQGAAERTVEDVFIRRFMFGTFHGCLADEVVIKRRGNMLMVCALMLQKMPPQKFYFLIGYSESLLSHFYKCPVKLDIQTLQDKAVYKYLWQKYKMCYFSLKLYWKKWDCKGSAGQKASQYALMSLPFCCFIICGPTLAPSTLGEKKSWLRYQVTFCAVYAKRKFTFKCFMVLLEIEMLTYNFEWRYSMNRSWKQL